MKFVPRWSSRRHENADPEAFRRTARSDRRRVRSDDIAEVQEAAERLNELAVMSLFLHSAGTMEEMLALFLERSTRVSGATVTYPLLLDRRRDLLQALPLANIEDEGLDRASCAANVNLVDLEYPLPLRSWRRSVMEGGEVVLADDLEVVLGDVLGRDACERVRKQLRITKVGVVPLVMEGEAFGLCVFLFSGVEPDVDVLELAAGHCTLAIKDLMAGEESTRFGGIDPVTWVHSRGFFLEALESEVTRARRYNRGLSVVLFDLYDFSEFNASYGHTLGDRLLRSFAMTLAGSITLPEIVARFGGDEFAVLLPETNRAGAVELTSSVVKKLSTLSVFGSDAGGIDAVTASAAIVSYPEDGSSRDELLAAMEIALEQSKEERRAARHPQVELTAVQQLRLAGRRHTA